MQDAIVREITVKAPKERVYDAITDPQQLVAWFPDAIEEGTLEVGQRPVFVFTEDNHRARLYVEAAKPFEYFAYRWVPGSAEMVEDVLAVPNTLVEFRIEEQPDGTKVTVRESGFSSLPPEVAEQSLGENTEGWGHIVVLLEKHLNRE